MVSIAQMYNKQMTQSQFFQKKNYIYKNKKQGIAFW